VCAFGVSSSGSSGQLATTIMNEILLGKLSFGR
jgi:hypothetical protein